MESPTLIRCALLAAVVFVLHTGYAQAKCKGNRKGHHSNHDRPNHGGCGCRKDHHDQNHNSSHDGDNVGNTGGGVGGAGELVHMGYNGDEERERDQEQLDRDTKQRYESRRKRNQAPLVCFVRGDGLMVPGLMRFRIRTVPIQKCTHVIFSYLETDNKTGEFIFRKRGTQQEREVLRKLAALKKSNPDLKVLFSYGGGAHVNSLLNRLRSKQDIDKMVEAVNSLIRSNDLDGVNFHLEGPGPSICKGDDVDKFLQFIKKLRLKEIYSGILITVQLPACRDSKCDQLPKSELAKYLDYYFLMAFDYRLDDLSKTRLTSGIQLFENGKRTHVDTDGCLNQWVNAKVPKDQIVMGIATHGRTYTLENQRQNGIDARLKKDHPLGYGANFTKTAGYMNYLETCRRVHYYKWTRVWVDPAKMPYIHYQDQWISYEDKHSAYSKVLWMKENKFGGIFLWSVDADDFSGSCEQSVRYPMVEAARQALDHYRPFN